MHAYPGEPGDSRKKILLVAAVLACFSAFDYASANPSGRTVVSGSASFVNQGSLLTVTNSPGAVIEWQSFSIGAGETTRFAQQSSTSSVLNRVIGPDPSWILGTLTSNGRVFLINQSGIIVGAGARIDVGGFVASTLHLSNADFAAGQFNFQPNPGGKVAAVTNNGAITTPTGGRVYLVGQNAVNSGVITAPNGQIILAAGRSVRIADTSTPGVTVEVAASDTARNLGTLLAQSGTVGLVGSLVRNSGRVNADQVSTGPNGRIFLTATRQTTLEAGGRIENRRGVTTLTGATNFMGTIRDGSLVASTLTPAGGTLEYVTLAGNMSLNSTTPLNVVGNLLLADGVTLNIGAGALNFAGTGLQHLGSPGRATVVGAGGVNGAVIRANMANTGAGLRIDGAMTVRNISLAEGYAGQGVINAGTLVYDAAPGNGPYDLSVNSSFTNTGTLSVTGAAVYMNSKTVRFTNSGTLRIDRGVVGSPGTELEFAL